VGKDLPELSAIIAIFAYDHYIKIRLYQLNTCKALQENLKTSYKQYTTVKGGFTHPNKALHDFANYMDPGR
jgi:3-dehydroquinate dehydratase